MTKGNANYGIAQRHNEQFNTLYFDGHCGSLRDSNPSMTLRIR